MKIGRNDACPCGSGKKYKKCCLAKDEAAARQGYVQRVEAQQALAAWLDRPPVPEAPLAPPRPSAPLDPLDQARTQLWEALEAAEPAEQPALFHGALAEPGLLDAEMAFEMVCAIRDNHDRAVFAQALDALQERRPELYERDAPYYLDWRIGDALAVGDLAALPDLSAALAAAAGRDLDIFYISLDKLAYHGQLGLAAQMMAQAWPHLGASQELVPWAQEEFAGRAMDLTLCAHLERTPDLSADDPGLRAALAVFAPVDAERLAAHLALLAGRAERQWTLGDFAFRQRKPRTWDDAAHGDAHDPAAQRLDDLSLVFLGALFRERGISLSKGDLARRAITRSIIERHAGKLDPVASPFGASRRPKGSKPARSDHLAPAHPLCPDRETLDRFLAGMLNFISPQYYDAVATLELTPAWLDLLQAQGLLTAEQRRAAQTDLRKLVADAAPLWEQRTADPTVGPNIRRAWEYA